MHAFVQENVTTPLESALGLTLKRVIYRCLSWECTYEDVEGPLFYMGGEVELRFDDGPADQAVVFLSWNKVPEPWRTDLHLDYCIEASLWEPFFTAGGIEPYDATRTSLWAPLVGTRLEKVDLLGREGIPYALRFSFVGGVTYIGSGTAINGGWGFGDGDDTLVGSEDEVAPQFEWRFPEARLEHIATVGEK